MEWFRVEWKGPYAVETAEKRKEAQDVGVYAIYETKGRTKKLLYIGETYSQGFARRIKQHRREWLHNIDGPKVIYFGVPQFPKGKRISYARVRDIEAVLLHCYRPPCCTVGKRRYSGRDILVVNTGRIGGLHKVVSHDRELVNLIQ